MDRRGDHASRTVSRRAAEYGLIASIFGISLMLWIVSPLGALWVASRLTDDGFLIVFAGAGIVCPLLMALFGFVLAWLNGTYLRLVGAHPSRQIPSWRSSLSGDRSGGRRPKPVLEVSLALSVVVAGVALAVFFLFFAHNANPGQPGL